MAYRLSKHNREQMAKALARHKLKDRADALIAESTILFHAVIDERQSPETKKLMAKLMKLHPNAFATSDSERVNANGMYIYVGSTTIGSYQSVHWLAKAEKLPVLHRDGETVSPELSHRIADFGLANKKLGEDAGEAYRKALSALAQFSTGKNLSEEWPEAMPVIGHLIPSEDRQLPTVQLASINSEFDLPPDDAALTRATPTSTGEGK